MSNVPVEDMVAAACVATRREPDLALNMEICDVIKQRGKDSPRNAAMALAKYISGRNQTTALHALALLDQCVKNCGYAFHLQIASKDFLNELVRNLSTKPGATNPVQYTVLQYIQQWKHALCDSGRYKADFVHVADMFEALQHRGFRFPKLNKSDVAVLVPKEGFKTEEEMEAEDRAAQEAKLADLLRRGTPAALEEANELMKLLAGYDLAKRPDYKKEAEKGIKEIEDKLKLFNEIIDHAGRGGASDAKDTISELLAFVKSAQTRVQRFVSEAEDDERLAQYLFLNDSINTTLERHDAFKKGKPIPPANVAPESSSSAAAPAAPKPQPPVSLIDFDFGEPAPSTASTIAAASTPVSATQPVAPASAGVMDDLLGLTIGGAAPAPPRSAPGFAANPFFVTQSAPQAAPLPFVPMAAGNPVTPVQPSAAQNVPRFVNPLPPQVTPAVASAGSPDVTIFDKNGLRVVFRLAPGDTPTARKLLVAFVNQTAAPIESLVFEVAVPKTVQLQMPALSTSTVAPQNAANPLTQVIQLIFPSAGELVKLKYRIQFVAGSVPVADQGDFAEKQSALMATTTPAASQQQPVAAQQQPPSSANTDDLLLL